MSGGDISTVFDAKSIFVDAALGAAGAGLTNKVNAIYRARNLPVSLGTKIGAQSSTKYEEGVYIAQATAGKYVGQSGETSTRLASHTSKSRFGAGSAEAADDAIRLSVGGGKTSREVAEQRVLNSWGGPKTEGVLNKVNPVGGRPGLLANESLGVVQGIYVPRLSNGAAVAAGAGIGAGFNSASGN